MSTPLPQASQDWLELLRSETRRRTGKVPDKVGGTIVEPGKYLLVGDEFLMREPGGAAFHYRKGEGVTVDVPAGADPQEIELWLNGTLHAAIASINGLIPLHASAVAHRGQVFAFTGPNGAGKSTLVAALAKRGFRLYCDDSLLIISEGAGSDTARPNCLPGHKRLKLWPEGLELAGVESLGQVSPSYPKLFASASGSDAPEILPFAALTYLEQGEAIEIEPVTGAERIARFCSDHYTLQIHEDASRMDREGRFDFLASLARRIPSWRFTRPFDPARFSSMVEAVAGWIEEQAVQ